MGKYWGNLIFEGSNEETWGRASCFFPQRPSSE